jgi:uncharacterized membrane protein YeaQ/YmgE (transglycosylase-associated protein family)
MGFISWAAVGLIMGSCANFVLPGRAPGGRLATVAVAVAASLFGGILGTLIGLGADPGFDVRSFLIAVFCAIGSLFVFRLIVDRKLA